MREYDADSASWKNHRYQSGRKRARAAIAWHESLLGIPTARIVKEDGK